MNVRAKLILVTLIGIMALISPFSLISFPKSSAFGIVQDNSALLTGACGAVSTGSNAFTSPVTGGDSLVAMVAYSSGSAEPSHDITMTSNNSNTWTRAVTGNLTSGVAGQYIIHVGIFYVSNAASGATSIGCIISGGAIGGDTILSIFEITSALLVAETNNTWPTGNLSPTGVTIGSSVPQATLVFSTIALSSGVPETFSCTCSIFNSQGNGIVNALADGTGAGKWTSANAEYAEADAGFGINLVTTTKTVTGFVVPSFTNGSNNFGWYWGIIFLILPLAIDTEIIVNDTAKNVIIQHNVIIFLFLGSELLASIVGVLVNLIPIAIPFVMALLVGIYLWRGR